MAEFVKPEARRYYKNNEGKKDEFLADIAYSIAEMEEKLFSDLRQWLKQK